MEQRGKSKLLSQGQSTKIMVSFKVGGKKKLVANKG